MQQVGGSIGAAAISTVVLTAAANYLTAHPAGALAQATAATHGYTTGFAVSAAVLAAAALVTFTVLPSKRELARRQNQSQPVTSAPAATAPDAISNPASPVGEHAQYD